MANVKTAYASSATITNAIESLATSSSWTAGYESDVLDNTSNLYLDYLISGKITTGTSPSSGVIEVWAIGILDDSTYPDVFDGTTGAETITSREVLYGHGKLVAAITNSTNSDTSYYFGPVSLASLFGGQVPKKVVFFTVHNTGVNLNSTASNHKLYQTGVYATVA